MNSLRPSYALLFLSVLLIAGCGNKGNLVLPDKDSSKKTTPTKAASPPTDKVSSAEAH